jgi:uroporphyrin-III C-methyltransferase
MNKTGKVFICGAGPGDPKLITVKAAELLKSCEVVLYDRLVSNAIIDQIPMAAEKIYVGREVGDPTTHQEDTNKLMVNHARNGKNVLRLKGGDPFIFGRGAEEAEYLLENGIDFEIIPGITSALGSTAYAGIPLTHRKYSSSLAIVTGHEDPSKVESAIRWAELAHAVDTIVVLMGTGNIAKISADLLEAGMNPTTPVAIIERGTTEKQRTISGMLGNISIIAIKSRVKAPSIIVIGNVVSLNKKLSWFEK